MEARQGKFEISRFRTRQRKPTSSGRSLSNEAQRAKKGSGELAAEATPKVSICRSHAAARGLSQGRLSRKILLPSAGLLQTIHSVSTIAAAKILFVQLSQRFAYRLAARTTLAPKAGDRLQMTTRWPLVRHPKSAVSCHAYRFSQAASYDSSELSTNQPPVPSLQAQAGTGSKSVRSHRRCQSPNRYLLKLH